ncbi:hypothetical protein [Synoicihabitans lomoniglobus]|uniref:DUF4340 domain-containing protein n=1 Tax=Synoicihabitans lomoniglobus TaxID=2909285 RepID=A0AAF0CRC2_9BACT|nr:hypothetical protein [Opitutaceae bacterium LMO-M01]WED66650.1 hypothetical protein PXH66_07275 [Opitutaceae bacterium LMO-M01]
MKRIQNPDTVALMLAGLLLASAIVVILWGERTVAQAKVRAPILQSGEGNGIPVAEHASFAPDDVIWSDPGSDAAGNTWIFELFTPPVIYYNRSTGRFTVTPPQALRRGPDSDDDPFNNLTELVAAEPFGVSLVGVSRQPFRLQLVGYAGEPGDYMGIFQNEETGEAFVARAPIEPPGLNLQVRTIEVRREDLVVPDSMPLREIVAVAEVWDAQTERRMRLSSAGWQWTEAPAALIRVDGLPELQTVRSGDRVNAAGITFEIQSVGGLPESVTIRKLHPDGTHETVTIHPETSPSPPIEGDSPFASS